MAKILLVDDDADIRRMVKKILESQGYQVVVVDNGLTALDEINANHYDMLISDANMPHYSGFDLIKALRKQKRHDNLVIAMLTGRREREDIERAIRLNVDDYIVKPISPEVLLEKVLRLSLIDKSRPAQPVIEEDEPLGMKAFLQTPIEVLEIHEHGITASSPVSFPIGSLVHFRNQELGEAGIDINQVKITGCQTCDWREGQFTLFADFVDLSKESREYLLAFLNYKQSA